MASSVMLDYNNKMVITSETRKARKRLSLDVFYTKVKSSHRKKVEKRKHLAVTPGKTRTLSTQSCKEPEIKRNFNHKLEPLKPSGKSDSCMSRSQSSRVLDSCPDAADDLNELSFVSGILDMSYGTVFSPSVSPGTRRHSRKLSENSRTFAISGAGKKIKHAIVTPVRDARMRILRKLSENDKDETEIFQPSLASSRARISASVVSLPSANSPKIRLEQCTSSELLDGKTRVETDFNIANIATSVFKKRRSDYFQTLSAWRSDKVTAIKTLRQFLTKKSRVASFREFLKKEFSEENLDFWLEIESYRKQKSNKQLKLAPIIYETYIVVNAPREINIDAGTRATTKYNMQKPDSATFDLAQVRVFLLMERDSFCRFLLSELKPTVTTKQPNSPKVGNKTKTLSKEKKNRRSIVNEAKDLKFVEITNANITERRKRKFSS